MALIQPLIAELRQESPKTRKFLERVPEEDFGWKPHEKSMSLGELAAHLAEIPAWVEPTMTLEELILDPGSFRPSTAKDRNNVLETFDRNVARAVELMQGVPDKRMKATWSLKMGDKVVLSLPRVDVLRGFILSHTIHHRGQLSVYLRLRNVPLPQIYGPTADEPYSQVGD